MMNTYRPSGAIDGGSLPAMFAWVAGGVLVTALAVGAMSHYVMDPVLLVALVVGLGAGLGARSGVKAAHFRSVALATALGIVAGAMGYVGTLYVHYRLDRRDPAATFAAEQAMRAYRGEPAFGEHPSVDPDKSYDALLVKEHGRSGFAGWVSRMVANGVSISISKPGRRSGGGLNIGSLGTAILLFIELALAAFGGAAWAHAQAEEPYCERCHRWLDTATWERQTTAEALKRVRAALGSQDRGGPALDGLLASLPPGSDDGLGAKVLVHQCPGCEEGYVFGSLMVPGKHGVPVSEPVFAAIHASTDALRTMLRHG